MACSGYWKTVSYKDDWTGDWEQEEIYIQDGCETVDISLHAYECKKCGKIGYYSHLGEQIEKGLTKDPRPESTKRFKAEYINKKL
jgi:hypothetical protein